MAVQCGISPVDFWRLTPYLTQLAVAALSEGSVTTAWINACLVRTQKFPKLSEIIGRKEPLDDVGARLKSMLSGLNVKKKT